MILLLSGEGPTDIGQSTRGSACWGDEFQVGPMARLIEQVLEPCLSFQILEHARLHDKMMVHFIPKFELSLKAKSVRHPKSLLLTGNERPAGTLFHRKFAYTLGIYAKELESQYGDSVLGVMFRDSDGTQSCPRTDWQDKRVSIEKGFEVAQFNSGVAMVPKPKSEAWLLCALQRNHSNCESLEDESGNDNSPNNLKLQLRDYLGCDVNAQLLDDMVSSGRVIAREIKMPSFVAFLNSLLKAAQYNGLDTSEIQ